MLTWPSLLAPSSGGYAPFVRSLSGGQSLSGFEQVQPQLSDRWGAAFSFPVTGQASQLALSSLLARLRGRANTIGLPDFRRVAPPLSAATPGVPLGTSVVNPPFWELSQTWGAPVGTSVSNPMFSVRWPSLAGSPFEFAPVRSISGAAVIVAPERVRFTPTGAAPEAGQYINLFGAPRLIVALTVDGSARLLTIDPGFVAAAGDTYSALGAITGTALIETASRVRFIPTGTQPAIGQYVTLVGVRRLIEDIVNDGGDRLMRLSPPLTIGAATPGTVAATVAANAALNATSIDIHFGAGGPPIAGHRFSLGSRLYEISDVSALGGGAYRCTIWPWLRAAVTSGAVANFTAPLCEMRLASDQEGADALRSLNLLRFADVNLRFDEASAT